jgi:phage terminase large subunit GpA-like protein
VVVLALKLRDRNEALNFAVLARAAVWLLGADRYSERFWRQLRCQIADAPLRPTELPIGRNIASPWPACETATPLKKSPSSWRAPCGGCARPRARRTVHPWASGRVAELQRGQARV